MRGMRSPYRTAPPGAKVAPFRSVFRGRDEARFSLALWLAFLVPFAPLATRVGVSGPAAFGLLVLAIGVVAVIDGRTRRFSLHIGPSGMVLRRYRLWWVRTRIQRVSLEWGLHTDEDMDRDDRSSFAMSLPRREVEARGFDYQVTVFGPTHDSPEMRATLEEMKASLQHHRAAVSSADTGREGRARSGDVGALFDRVDPASVERGPWGRVRSMRLSRGALLDGLRLPPGTVVEFGFADEWQAPSTPDRVTGIRLGGKAVWKGLPAMLCAGARVELDTLRRIKKLRRAFEGPLRIQGVLVHGGEEILFDHHGELTSCALASDLAWGPLRLPAGTAVDRRGADWLGFHGRGIRVEGTPDARPTKVHASIVGKGKRAPLSAILSSPAGKVGTHLSLCEHEAGTQHERHRSVPFSPDLPAAA